jgi:hypothetical protein
MRSLAFVALLSSLTACSASLPSAETIATTNRPCSTDTSAPDLDTEMAFVGGVVTLLGLVAFLTADSDGGDDDAEGIQKAYGTLIMVPGGILTVAYGLSAHHGKRSVSACEQRNMWGPPGPPPGI